MTTAALRVPRKPQISSPNSWFSAGLGVAAAWAGNTVTSAYYNGKTYFAYCDAEGNARVVSYNHSTQAFILSPVVASGLDADGHSAPSVLVRSSDHKIVVAVAGHDSSYFFIIVSTNAEDISSWAAATNIAGSLGGSEYAYSNIFQLSGESGKLHLFYRDYVPGTFTGRLAHSISTDGGATWAAQTVLFTPATGKVSYWAISSDDTSRIDIVISDGNAPSGDTASAYHFYYTGGSFFKSDGTLISAGLPWTAANVTKIYDGATNGNVRAPYDIATNGGNPCAVWASYNSAGSGSNSNYWYGSCSSGVWTVNQISSTGAVPDPVFQEGGAAIDATNPARVFLSKMTSSVWQMFKYETSNAGASWTNTQLTTDSSLTPTDVANTRPRSPRNAAAAVTMVFYIGPNYTLITGIETPSAQVRLYPNPIQPF